MALRRRLVLLGAPIVGAAALGTVVAFSVPALAASPSPSPSANGQVDGPSQGAGAPAQGSGHQGNCPNM